MNKSRYAHDFLIEIAWAKNLTLLNYRVYYFVSKEQKDWILFAFNLSKFCLTIVNFRFRLCCKPYQIFSQRFLHLVLLSGSFR